MNSAPGYVIFILYLMLVMTAASIATLVGMFVYLVWDAWKKHKKQGGTESDDGGSGGWWKRDKPKGKPPSGPDRDIDQQFHAVADAIGKTMNIGEKDKEKVLT